MKKKLLAILMAAMLALTACGGSKTVQVNDGNTSEENNNDVKDKEETTEEDKKDQEEETKDEETAEEESADDNEDIYDDLHKMQINMDKKPHEDIVHEPELYSALIKEAKISEDKAVTVKYEYLNVKDLENEEGLMFTPISLKIGDSEGKAREISAALAPRILEKREVFQSGEITYDFDGDLEEGSEVIFTLEKNNDAKDTIELKAKLSK